MQYGPEPNQASRAEASGGHGQSTSKDPTCGTPSQEHPRMKLDRTPAVARQPGSASAILLRPQGQGGHINSRKKKRSNAVVVVPDID